MSITDVDHIEIHEAFAVPVVVWLRHFNLDQESVNQHGGAIGMGHPFAASGTRQLLHLSHLVHQSGGRGLQTMCGGGGLGSATIIKAA
jgi:acetyl-CoA acetyltransferase